MSEAKKTRKFVNPRKPGISARNKQYWINRGYTEEDAIKEARTRMPGTFEYFRYYKMLNEEEALNANVEWRKNHKSTLENFILRHGKEEGEKKWNDYRMKQAETNSLEYKKEKYGWTEEQFKSYNKSRAVTLENFIIRHGEEEANIRWKGYCDRQKYAGCEVEYFIEKYGEEEGIKRYKHLNFMKGHTFDSYLFKFDGDEKLAWEAFSNYQANLRTPHSNIATELFDSIYEYIIQNTDFKKIFYINNIGEWFVHDNNKKRTYFLDFFLKERGKVIEFYGDYWHANPNKYQPESVLEFPKQECKIAEDIWKSDSERIDIVLRHPDIKDVKIIWEMEYNNDKNKILQECIQYLTQ